MEKDGVVRGRKLPSVRWCRLLTGVGDHAAICSIACETRYPRLLQPALVYHEEYAQCTGQGQQNKN